MVEEVDIPPSFSFHFLTASTMLMPWDILSLRKRLYALGLRFSRLADFFPRLTIVCSCFLIIAACSLMVFLKSLSNDELAFSRYVSRVLSLLMSASRDFGIPAVFGIATRCFDEKKRVPLTVEI